ncbi:ribosomal-processing cysteine protease Prp [Tepidibacter mesophilus]|uniref:ribosomal-processing cysteine protease Prp n=1 Tax=Tepidibacter mesophilus TaxID=655607 RepID=UPI000C076FA2|nr:ribosomal-processing cysteine protease Prp [Tepidibacter mesophilus]
MKKLHILIGGIMCIILFTGIAAASEITETINVVFNKVNLEVNGQPVKSNNILYNGTTYVPLRSVSEMMNKKIEWNGNTNTANINDTDKIEASNNLTKESIVLDELPLFNGKEAEGITVKTYVNKNGIIYGFEVSGHSGYEEYGKDIVCAAVSTIGQNTLTSIKVYTKDNVEERIESGYLKCILPNMKNNIGSKESCVLLKSALVGFYAIESSYGSEYVKVFKVID